MYADKIMTDEKIKNQQGDFFDFNHYHTLINKDIDIYTPEGHLLFSIRKNIIPKKISAIAKKHLLPHALSAKSNNRGIATGKVNIDSMNKSIVEILDPGNFKTRVKYDDGHVSKYKISNNCKSMIAGYYDKSKHCNNTNIRLTAFSNKYVDDWYNTIIYVQYLDKIYKSIYKSNYLNRKKKTKLIKYGIIDDTIFTTLTINYNFRTACHVDKGNDEYSILTVIGNWKGCYLGYPQYGVCVNVEEGDFLIMNPYEYHCNTEFTGSSNNRMSIVTYSRNGIINRS